MAKDNSAIIQINGSDCRLAGDWSYRGLRADTGPKLRAYAAKRHGPIHIKANEIHRMDTSGAWLIYSFLQDLKAHDIQFEITGLNPDYEQQLDLVSRYAKQITKIKTLPIPNMFARAGMATIQLYNNISTALNFIGETFIKLLAAIRDPRQIRWAYLFKVIELNGYHALPIIGFLSFLIGVVLTYQLGLQLKSYGANIFIVSLLGIAILREFGPLITALIITGRTGSSYTAQIGVMKINEEIDALRTMGFSPNQFLVIPRVLGLVIVMPLLTVWADIFGVVGGMAMSKGILGISYYDFMHRFPYDVTFTTFWIGMIKAPVFALLIATVGCFHGFKVKGSSESIGWETTKSVVMAIFLIIIADASFSILFSWLDI